MAAAGFDVLLTVDQNLRYQQNLSAAGVAIVVMVARTKRAYGAARSARDHQSAYMMPEQHSQQKVAGAPGSPGSRTSKRASTSCGIRSCAPHCSHW
jgi:hypothetical protein